MLSFFGAPLSVLDTSPIVEGSSSREALLNTLDLAQLADDLGFHRYWVPEHHSMRGVASAAPAVIVGQLASATKAMRLGSGGVLLANHAPIVVAEQFGTLEAFHPGRIDLGIGRALGGTKRTAELVRKESDRIAKPFGEQLTELLSYFDEPTPGATHAVPAVGNSPTVWLLGSSDFSAKLAGSLGLPFAFAHHLNARAAKVALVTYRDTFRPSRHSPEPQVMLSVAAVLAETDDHAQWLAGPAKRKFLGRVLGERILLPDPEKATAFGYREEHRSAIEEKFSSTFIGSAETVRKNLETLLDETGANELMVTTQVFNHTDRRRSYQLLAELTR